VPVVEATAGRLLSLPLFPQLTQGEVRRVIDALAAPDGALTRMLLDQSLS
jgi:dTDP-4-amino-4,6-dideoxygalactose transaminase